MRLSLITIAYNAEATIFTTLKSVQNQTYTNFEHILIDGKSTDNTLEICSEFPHISKIVSESDKGVYDAFNKGLNLATGDVIGFLNSDDIFLDKNSLKHIVNTFDEQTDCVFGNLDYVNPLGKVVRKWRSKPFQKGAFLKAWMPAHPTFYCRKEVYDRLGGYDDSYKIAGDFELMLRFLEKHEISSKFIDKTLVNMLSGGLSNSGIKSKLQILREEFYAFKQNEIEVNKFNYIFHKIGKLREFF